MAKVTFGGGIASMSGKLGGQVASRNKGGAYMRTWVMPTNPSTPAQEAARSRLGVFSQEWRTLTSAQRDAWVSWADENPVLDRLGASIILTGAQAYTKININRDLAGDATTNSTTPSPAVFALQPITLDTLAADVSDAEIICDLGATAAADQIYFVYAVAPVSAGVSNTVSQERLISVNTLVAGDIAAALFPDVGAAYVTYFGSVAGATGLAANVAIYQYSQGQLGVAARLSTVWVA